MRYNLNQVKLELPYTVAGEQPITGEDAYAKIDRCLTSLYCFAYANIDRCLTSLLMQRKKLFLLMIKLKLSPYKHKKVLILM